MKRRSIYVHGLSHGDLPIPAASRIGPFLVTGGIRGVNRATNEMPDDADAQAALMFSNLAAILAAGGATLEYVLRLTIWIKEAALRSIVNPGWLECFPDPASRPARHILVHDLPGKLLIQCEAMAICPDAPAVRYDESSGRGGER